MRSEVAIERPRVRRRRSSRRVAVRRAVFLAVCVGVLAALLGVVFAGSPATLAEGTSIDGVDVGGMTTAQAVRELSRLAAARADDPVTFVAAGKEFSISPTQLGVKADWRAAVATAAADSSGFRPIRGFKRLHIKLFGAEVEPSLSVYSAALAYKLDQIEAAVEAEAVDASLKLDGLRVRLVPGTPGRALDRPAAEAVVVRALADLSPVESLELPVVRVTPSVTAPMLARARADARTALSKPVRMTDGTTSWRLSRVRIASLLRMPAGGAADVAIGGRGAEAWVEQLAKAIERTPQDARFALTAQGQMTIEPSRPGRALDVPATLKSLSAAVQSPSKRVARAVVRVEQPQRTTAEARAMGITGVVSSYTTSYGGTEGRVHNVQLVADLIDGALVAPGATFSFNGTTGERNAEKGFAAAPVIINGELQNGIGGGVCQVSTTVFNAAFDAGLPIEKRTNHALYIDHYPLGRDATVNYPDLDLTFRNDTAHWLLLRTFVGSGSLTVNLYGTPMGRRVESETAPLTVTGEMPVDEVEDPSLEKGTRVVEETGAPPRETSVHRVVYDEQGNVLHEDTWASRYVAEPELVRVGTKEPRPKPGKAKTAKKQKQQPAGDEPVPGIEVPAPALTTPGARQ